MSSPTPRLEQSIRAHLVPRLQEDGFKGSGRTFRRLANGFIQLVSIQGSRYGGQFAINLGIHPVSMPAVLGNAPDPKKITEPDCEFRRRLSESGTDQWWQHEATEPSMDAAVAAAAGVYVRIARPMLDRLAAPDSPILTLQPQEMPSFRERFCGFGSTEVRVALALAMLRKSAGDLPAARAFAAYGLANVGQATSLRAKLEEILRES